MGPGKLGDGGILLSCFLVSPEGALARKSTIWSDLRNCSFTYKVPILQRD